MHLIELIVISICVSILIQTSYSVDHKDCRCWVENRKRDPCPMGEFLDEAMCTASGCCFHTNKTVTVKVGDHVVGCYMPLDECHEIKQCQIMSSERKPCRRGHWTNPERICKFRGCCFNPHEYPYCYSAQETEGVASSRFNTLQTPPPSFFENDESNKVEDENFGEEDEVRPKIGRDETSVPEDGATSTEEDDNTDDKTDTGELPAETIRGLIANGGLNYRCPKPSDAQVSCGDNIYTREECMVKSCCWAKHTIKKSISGYICVHAVVNHRNTSEKPSSGRIPDRLISQWEPVPPGEAEPNVGDEDKMSMMPQAKFQYPDFSVSMQCPNHFENLITYTPCEATSRHECIAKKCCWVYDANSEAEYGGTCLTPRVKYDNYEIFHQFSDAEDVPVEIVTEEFDPGYWVPGEPVQVFTTPDNITVRLTCPNDDHSETCGNENISKDECLASGCCWMPGKLFSNKNYTTPCFASVVTLLIEDNRSDEDWGPWTDWSKCKPLSPCSSEGFRSRKRECLSAKKSVYGHCDGVSEVIASCGDFNECGEARWTDWTRWSICSSTCSAGFRFRARRCNAPEGLESCLSEYQPSDLTQSETEPCNVDKCTLWSDWEITTPCTDSCVGAGFETKSRHCLQFSSRLQFLRDQTVVLKSIPLSPVMNINFDLSLNHEEECYASTRPCNASGICLPYWGEWEGWAECTPACSNGVSERMRYCYLDGQDGLQEQDPSMCRDLLGGSPIETRPCNFDTCDGWGPWDSEGECKAECGQEGTIKTTRECLLPGPRLSNIPEMCFEMAQQCTGKPCYTWGEFVDWSPCSSSCSPGEMSRSRPCFDADENEVDESLCGDEEEAVEVSLCNEDMCDVWGEWAAEGACSAACLLIGEIFVTRKCLNEAIDTSAHPDRCYEAVEPCFKECSYGWGNWSEWSSCPDSCTQGLRSRARKCLRDDEVEVDSNLCTSEVVSEVESCNDGECALWGDWISTDCFGSCDEGLAGYRTEGRTCLVTSSGIIEESCYKRTVPCELSCDMKWSEWQDWSACSDECGPGYQTRRRDCLRWNRVVDSKQCSSAIGELDAEFRPCNENYCSDWSPFGTVDICRARCNHTVTRIVFRTCNNDLSSELQEELRKCYFKEVHCTGDCKPRWGMWGRWEMCQDKCGPSDQKRERICYFDGAIADASVCADAEPVDSIVETRPCNTNMCTSWSRWSATKCSQPCYGTQQLTRSCIGEGNVSSSDGDTSCLSKEDSCGPKICPFRYTEWTEWTKCSMECSPGKQSRSRKCIGLKNNTLLLSKCAFLGPAKETQACNDGYCRRWLGWRPHKCSLNCGGDGVKTRTRKCDLKEMNQQEMEYRHARKCFKVTSKCTAPPCEGDWTNWLSWTECSRSCGPGVRSKIRKCVKKGTRDTEIQGGKCSGGNNLSHEKDKCNKNLCQIWSEWKNSECSVSCGIKAGSYRRTRICTSAADDTAPGLRSARGGDLCYKRNLWCEPKPCT